MATQNPFGVPPGHYGGSNPAHANLSPMPRPRRYFVRNPLGKWVEVNQFTYDMYRHTYDAFEECDDCVARMALAVVE